MEPRIQYAQTADPPKLTCTHAMLNMRLQQGADAE